MPTFLNLLAKVYAALQGSALPANHPQTACLGVLLPLCDWVLAHGRYSSRKGFHFSMYTWPQRFPAGLETEVEQSLEKGLVTDWP